jgi:hypothetical protein
MPRKPEKCLYTRLCWLQQRFESLTINPNIHVEVYVYVYITVVSSVLGVKND